MATKGKEGNPARPGEARRKGIPNKKTRDLIELLNERGYCPVAQLIETATIARMEYDRAADVHDAILENRSDARMKPINNEAATFLKIMGACASDLMPYIYPKRKAIELMGAEGKDLFQSFSEMAKQVLDESTETRTIEVDSEQRPLS